MSNSLKHLCLALALTLTGCSDNDSDKPKETYIVGTSADYAPFEFFKDNQITGYDIDVIHAIANKIGIKIEIKDMNFDGILGSLQSKRIDMAISALTPTPERQRAVDFSDIYYSTTNVLVCNDQSSVRAVTDLTGTVIGVQSGSIFEIYANSELKQNVGNIEIKSLPRIPDLMQELKTRRISCIIVGQKEGENMLSNQQGLRLVKIDSNESGFAVALPKGSSLTPKINQALKDLVKEGTLEKLSAKWLNQ